MIFSLLAYGSTFYVFGVFLFYGLRVFVLRFRCVSVFGFWGSGFERLWVPGAPAFRVLFFLSFRF